MAVSDRELGSFTLSVLMPACARVPDAPFRFVFFFFPSIPASLPIFSAMTGMTTVPAVTE